MTKVFLALQRLRGESTPPLALQRLTGEHTASSSGAGEKKQSPQKLFPLEKTGLELNRKVIRDGHRMQRDKGWARRSVGSSSLTSERNRRREKAKDPRSDALTEAVSGSVPSRGSTAQYPEERQRREVG